MTVDSRFYAPLGALTLESAAALAGAVLVGNGQLDISGVASADAAGPGELAFLEGDNPAQVSLSHSLQMIVVNEAASDQLADGVSRIVSRQPRHTHSLIARALLRPRFLGPAEPAAVSPSARVHPGAVVCPGAIIGAGAAVGEGTIISPNAVIGPGVQVGRHGFIGAGASVNCALIGDFVTLLAGARIGETGFGVIPGPNGLEDAPHFGRVILQDHVTVGANTCIDRGVFADTIIGERTKIDNLCQIAHNVVLGRSVIVAAFGGISGSVRVGDGSRLGGRVGIADHVKVGEGVSLAGSSGLFRDVAPGETWGGTPAKPIREWMREVAWLSKQTRPKKKD